MKIITLHCDYIRYRALKKALKDVELVESKEIEVKEPLVVLTAVEKGDTEEILSQMTQAVLKTAKEVKAENIVVYPYAHLSSNLASPQIAQEFLKKSESLLKSSFKKVERAPFGYYKSFELKCKGHPLSELSKEFKASSGKIIEENFDPQQLLKEISRFKLDTSKLKENDHRILGQRLDLFSFNEVSPGMVFWHDSGSYIYNKLREFILNLLYKYDYQIVSTPQILDTKIFKVSGHWNHYINNMFMTSYDDRSFGVKPMNCPGEMLIYKTKSRSYKDLPIRFGEFGLVHRQELSGVLAGLFRLNQFTQDDAHIFCTKEHIAKEIESILEMIDIMYKQLFGFNYKFELSTRPERFMGDKKDWDIAEKILEDVLKKKKVKFKINKGDGAFYGPKIDLHITDSLGREWQCATIQLDMQMPKRFDLKYIDKDGKENTPYVIHRAILGSIERFIGVLIEHLSANFPLWISPKQVRVINFTDRNTKACEKFIERLKKEIPEIRVETDFESDTVQSKIRNAELMKVNYIIVIGDKEEENNTLAVRKRGEKPKFGISADSLIQELKKELEGPKGLLR